MSRIARVVPKDDYTLLIELTNNHKIIYDMKPRLQSVRFCGLAELDRFKSVTVKHGNTLTWDDLCEITIDEIISKVDQ